MAVVDRNGNPVVDRNGNPVVSGRNTVKTTQQESPSQGAASLGSAKEIGQAIYSNATGFMKGLRQGKLPFGLGANPVSKTNSLASFGGSAESKDWRVKLSLPEDSSFQSSPILAPLVTTNGLVFPYTPTIIFSHSANYNTISPLHSNYPFFAYQNSQVDQMTITGNFYVQNALEAKYWLGAIHYLRSITKMFYGEGANSGNPPPVVRLNGYGDYMLKDVPVIITNFTFDAGAEIDYISTQEDSGGVAYVPTESVITVTVQPIYSRADVEQFSLESFVSGNYVVNGKGFM